MSEAQRHAAALADPDAQPLTDADMDRMKQTPRLKIIRRALGLTQEEFATPVSNSARHAAGLGAGGSATGSNRARLSSRHRRRRSGSATCARCWPSTELAGMDEVNEETAEEAARLDAEAVAAFEAGRFVTHDRVVEWLNSWGTPNELPCPKLDQF